MRRPELHRTADCTVVPVGHRGAPKVYPENTLDALNKAVEMGCWMVELDVRQTKDGVPVVFHDEDLKRMCGAEGAIANTTAKELAKLSVEGWFKVPTLEDALRRLRERAWINIEIKQADPAKVVEVLKAHGMTDQVIVSSFDWDVLTAFEQVEPTLVRALLTESRQDAVASLAKHSAKGWFPRADLVTADLVAQVHQAGAFLMPWTVDDPDVMRRLVGLGVDAICSNDIELLMHTIS